MAEPHDVRSLYIHVPFCRKRCPYCNYAIEVRAPEGGGAGAESVGEAEEKAWLEAISAEWEYIRARKDVAVQPLETLYVGGGTPSFLGASAIEGLRDLLGVGILGLPSLEWTIEANPEDLTPELAGRWREAGVNRVSIGAQSFQDPPLEWLGRPHRAAESEAAIEAARRGGIDNVSVDLAFGLPERVGHDWAADLERVVALRPPHVTLQEIAVEADTELASLVDEGREAMPPAEWNADAFLLASETLGAAGYSHYEISSFALPGRESRHGLMYASGAPYLGLGNAAHSYLPPRRSWNLTGWGGYCTAVRSDTLSRAPVVEGGERLTVVQARLEALWQGLRTRKGLLRLELSSEALTVVERWVREGLAESDSERVRLTAEGWLRLDALVLELERTLPA